MAVSQGGGRGGTFGAHPGSAIGAQYRVGGHHVTGMEQGNKTYSHLVQLVVFY